MYCQVISVRRDEVIITVFTEAHNQYMRVDRLMI